MKIFGLILFLLTGCVLFGQDKIIQTNNKTVNCKIISIGNDSVTMQLVIRNKAIRAFLTQDNIKRIILNAENEVIVDSTLSDLNKSKIETQLLDLNKPETNRNPVIGFFIGGGLSALRMSGKGEVADNHFNVKDDLFILHTTDSYYEASFSIEPYGGASWKNRFLAGFSPVLGYRFSDQFLVSASFTYFLKKNSAKSQRWRSDYHQGFGVNVEDNLEYSQSNFMALGQFNPASWKGVYLAAGLECTFLKAKLTDNTTVYYDNYPSLNEWKASGKDKAFGIVFGGGYEFPLSKNQTQFFCSVLYSLTKYKGDKLLKVDDASGYIFDSDIDMELGVGGLNLCFGLRKYLKPVK